MIGAEQSEQPVRDPAEELVAGLGLVTATLRAARGRSEPVPERVPVTVLVGPLGSGKTTVLRRLLAGDHGLRIAAVVNDLAAVNIDAESLAAGQPRGDSMLELSNGCACCALSDDLAETLRELAGTAAPDAIVVEASAASDAVALAATVEAEGTVRFDGIIGLIDAEAWPEQAAHPTLGPLLDQVLDAAHVVVLTKTDRCQPGSVADLTDELAARAPGRRFLTAVHGDLDPRVLLDPAAFGATLPAVTAPDHPELLTETIHLDNPIDRGELASWLDGDHGLLRAKGWVALSDRGPAELQVVGRRWAIEPSTIDRRVVVAIADSASKLAAATAELRSLASNGDAHCYAAS